MNGEEYKKTNETFKKETLTHYKKGCKVNLLIMKFKELIENSLIDFSDESVLKVFERLY